MKRLWLGMIAAVFIRFGRWCRSEWRELRHRVFGTATPAPYTPPADVQRLQVTTTAAITRDIEDHRRARGCASGETHLRLVGQDPAAPAREQQGESTP